MRGEPVFVNIQIRASTMAEVFRIYGIRGVWSSHHGPVAGMCYLEVLKESSASLRQVWDKEKGKIRKKAFWCISQTNKKSMFLLIFKLIFRFVHNKR